MLRRLLMFGFELYVDVAALQVSRLRTVLRSLPLPAHLSASSFLGAAGLAYRPLHLPPSERLDTFSKKS